jgi:DNA-binding transcriptional regulator GbsR (MarR family)
LDQTTQEFVERVGLTFEVDGMPRIAGRMLGLLLVSSEARTLDELADLLRVSKASISSNARLLERMGSVERVGHPGDRRDFYQLSHCMDARVLDHWTERMRELRDLMTDALTVPPASEPAVRERLEAKRAFFGQMMEELKAAGVRWRERDELGTEPGVAGVGG